MKIPLSLFGIIVVGLIGGSWHSAFSQTFSVRSSNPLLCNLNVKLPVLKTIKMKGAHDEWETSQKCYSELPSYARWHGGNPDNLKCTNYALAYRVNPNDPLGYDGTDVLYVTIDIVRTLSPEENSKQKCDKLAKCAAVENDQEQLNLIQEQGTAYDCPGQSLQK